MIRPIFINIAMLICMVQIEAEAQQPPTRKPLTVLISIDGFRPDYLTRGITPNLSALARDGTVAEAMAPSFPSVTFPNHITLVTGVVPDKHGIVNNVMNDPEIPNRRFRLSDRDVLSDPRWWSDVIPIWVTAHRQNKLTSTLFWPGSEVLIQGIQPDDWLPYQEIPSRDRVTKLLEWLDRPDVARADFATLYFSEIDILGHQTGTRSIETDAAIERVDQEIGIFIAGLERLGLKGVANLIIVSDHGMANTSPEKIIDLSKLFPELNTKEIVWTGSFAGIELKDPDVDAFLQRAGQAPNMECWRKSEIPARYKFGSHRRIPEVMCLARNGWSIVAGPGVKIIAGQHGYDPADTDMSAIFIASGPRLKPAKIGVIQNIEIYHLLCDLIGVTPAAPRTAFDLDGILLNK